MRSKIFLELIASELTVAYATQGLIMSEPIKKTKIIPLSISLFLSYPFLLFFRHFTKISSFCIHLYISTTNLLSWWQGHCLFSIKKIDRSFRSGRIFLFFYRFSTNQFLQNITTQYSITYIICSSKSCSTTAIREMKTTTLGSAV